MQERHPEDRRQDHLHSLAPARLCAASGRATAAADTARHVSSATARSAERLATSVSKVAPAVGSEARAAAPAGAQEAAARATASAGITRRPVAASEDRSAASAMCSQVGVPQQADRAAQAARRCSSPRCTEWRATTSCWRPWRTAVASMPTATASLRTQRRPST